MRDSKKAVRIAYFMRAVAHPIRIRVLAILCERELTVTEITEALGVPQAIVSQQLKILRTRELVKVSRRGLYAYYSLARSDLKKLVCCIGKCGK